MGTMTKAQADQVLDAIASGDAPGLERALEIHMDMLERSGLTQREFTLTRIAALVASDAAPASYLLHFRTAMDMGFDRDTLAGVLVSIAPVVGTAKITSAVSHVVRAGLLGEALQQKMSQQYS